MGIDGGTATEIEREKEGYLNLIAHSGWEEEENEEEEGHDTDAGKYTDTNTNTNTNVDRYRRRDRKFSTFHIETYGCQMNLADSDVVRSILLNAGYLYCDSPGEADIIFLNTCAIREKAESRIR